MSLSHIAPIIMKYVKVESFDKSEALADFNDDIRQRDKERDKILEVLEKVSSKEKDADPTVGEEMAIDGEQRKIESYNLDNYILDNSFLHSLQVI